MLRTSFPNPIRPRFWPGEEHHYRSELNVGDVVRDRLGHLGQIRAWNNTHSHVTAGRLVYLAPVLAYRATPEQLAALCAVEDIDGLTLYRESGAWEAELSPAEPGDIGAHLTGVGGTGWRYRPATWMPAGRTLLWTAVRP